MPQKKFWRELDQLKAHTYYMELYFERTDSLDRYLSMFLAVTSSSSICGWAVWSQFAKIWGAIIAASQLLSAINKFLPYKARLKALMGATREFQALFIAMEQRWFEVANGKLTEDEIHALFIEFKKKKQIIMDKYFASTPLPQKQKLHNQAEELARKYFVTFYS